jgi:sRNA-binding protein
MTKPWTSSRGPIVASETDLLKARAINALLLQPIDILPSAIGDPIKPFALGLWNEIRPLLRANVNVTALRRATAAYLHSKRYYLATAQPDSMRFDLQGHATEPVSAADRLVAQQRYETLLQSNEIPPTPAEAPPAPPTLTKSEQIRAALLSRRPTESARPSR